MDNEQYLRDRIADLQREYQKAAEPYIQKLVELKAMEPPKPFVVHWSNVSLEDQDRILRLAGAPLSGAPSQSQAGKTV